MRDLPQRRERRQVRRVEIERHLVALLRRDAVAELLVERLADSIERLDPLLACPASARRRASCSRWTAPRRRVFS